MQSITDSSIQNSHDSGFTMKNSSTISRRAIWVMSVFSLFLMIGICIVANFLYVKVKIEDSTDVSYAYAKAASRFINGDRISYYAATGKTDSYYYQVQKYLTTLLSTSGLEYFFVVVPTKDSLVYIWDPPRDDKAENYELGYKTAYPPGYSYDGFLKTFKDRPEEKSYYIIEEDLEETLNALYPIYDSEEEIAALVGVSITVEALENELIGFMIGIAVSIAVLVIIFAVFLYFYTKNHIIAPLAILNRGTRQMVSCIDSGSNFSLDIHTGDEIEELSRSFMSMHHELNEYLRALAMATAEKERIETELQVASSIQSSMLPKLSPEFASCSSFKIYASMTPAREVGGDFYDSFKIDENHLGIVIADVSGKGVSAALFMVIAKTLIKMRALIHEVISPSFILKTVNNQLIENNDAGMFVTVWLAIIDLRTGKGRASNAGHEHPVICPKGGDFNLVEYQHSPPLGCLLDMDFEEHEFNLNKGDTLFVYTDGVAEATNEEGKLYTTDRLVVSLNSHKGLEPEELVNAVHSDIDEYVGSAEQFDDITMLAFKYIGDEKSEA